MSIEVEVTGNGKFAGYRTNLESYSVTEDSTPTAPGDSSGGTGSIAFTATEDTSATGTILLLNDVITLSDTSAGQTQGTVTSVNVANGPRTGGYDSRGGSATVTADGRLGILNATGFVPAFMGDLDGAATMILGPAGITTGIVIEPSIAGTPVAFRGGQYNYWFLLKEIASAVGLIEVALVSNNVVVRPIREREAYMEKVSNVSWGVQNGELAQFVEVIYYNYEEIESGLVYPYGGWNPDVQILQVDAGQTITVNVPVNVSLTSIDQPVVQDFVDRYYDSSSVYSVAGNDGLPIPAAQWTAQGGSLTVAIGDDGQSIDVTMTGASEAEYAPYQIAVASGPSDYYSTLRLVGDGLGFTPETLRVPTGAPASKTAQEVGITIDNPAVNTRNDAYSAALRAAASWAAPSQTVTITATIINRSDSNGSYIYPTFDDFNGQYPTEDFDAFNAIWTGEAFAAFNAYQFGLVRDDFANQVFGNVGGARVLFRDAYYRIRNATVTQDGITTATAERDTTFGDFNLAYDGMTLGGWDAAFDGLKFEDYALIPLAKPFA